jgi:RNA-directed DNA polymerase
MGDQPFPESVINMGQNTHLDCIDEINAEKKKTNKNYEPTISHGFVRNRSILTNASMHLNRRNVLNLDLSDFFDSFNFGRVRGFFIKNRNFELDPDVATVLAQIACYNNKLPQGSPCSPVITNLITHSLDIRLASLARKHSCLYTRYADDITFSTRKRLFDKKIAKESAGTWVVGSKLKAEISRAGFSINNGKTRVQYKDSRQDVTGLVVNEKPNIKKEYWRTAKSQCNRLFHTGKFTMATNAGPQDGNINILEGQLNFIDQVDRFNRRRHKKLLNHSYQLASHGINTMPLLSGREKTFSKFLYYRNFYANEKPTILCEGKTDNVYLKAAISTLVKKYPKLARPATKTDPYELLVSFIRYSDRTKFLLQLDGSTSYLEYFIKRFESHFKFYGAPKPINPVIVLLDNDSGAKKILSWAETQPSTTIYPKKLKKKDIKQAEFIRVLENLYIVLTPLDACKDTEIEDLFDPTVRGTKLNGKTFNTKKKHGNDKEYGKEIFANKVVYPNKSSIDFAGFETLLKRFVKVMNHYRSLK